MYPVANAIFHRQPMQADVVAASAERVRCLHVDSAVGRLSIRALYSQILNGQIRDAEQSDANRTCAHFNSWASVGITGIPRKPHEERPAAPEPFGGAG